MGTPQIINQRVNGGSYTPGMQICPGNHWLGVTPVGGNAGVATWTVQPGIMFYVGTNTLDFTFPSSASSVTASAKSSNSCGTGANYSFYISKKSWGCSSSFSMVAYPNPSNNQLTIEMLSMDDGSEELPLIESAILYNLNSEEVAKGKPIEKKMIFNVSDLKSGTYYLPVKTQHGIIREQIAIR